MKIDISDDPLVMEYVQRVKNSKSDLKRLLIQVKRKELLRNYRLEKGINKPMPGIYRFRRMGLRGGIPAKKTGGVR